MGGRRRPNDPEIADGAERDKDTVSPSDQSEAAAATELQRTAGNRAVAGVIANATGGTPMGPLGVMTAALAGTLAGAAGSSPHARQPTNRESGPTESSDDERAQLQLAERWLGYIANRGNDVRPARPPPARYRNALVSIQSAVDGPGPARGEELLYDREAFGEARGQLSKLRRAHQRLLGDGETAVHDLAALAIDRGQRNFGDAPDAVLGGLDEYSQMWGLLSLWSMADSEIDRLTESGMEVPETLRTLSSNAQQRFEAARDQLGNRAPSAGRLVRPDDEADAIGFMIRGRGEIGRVRASQARIEAATREAEAARLRREAGTRLQRLRRAAAQRRRRSFMAGDADELTKVRRSLAALDGAAAQVEEAASTIDRYASQLRGVSRVARAITRVDVAVPEIPSLRTLTDRVTGPLRRFNEHFERAGVLLDLARPAKTELDEGLNALRAMGETAKLAGSVPLVDTYLDNYLGPALDQCLESIGAIAGQLHDSNMAVIAGGNTRFLPAVHWAVEAGGQPMHTFVLAVYEHGARAEMDDETWVDVQKFVADHRGDLAAAVGERPPGDRRALGAWAARHRQALWETLYGETPAPR